MMRIRSWPIHMHTRVVLEDFQRAQQQWSEANFGKHDYRQPFMGLVEEVGELSHALLKQEQGIRGTREEHEAAAKDAVGDVMIYLADLCSTRGWSLEECLREAWDRVQKRNWKADPKKGGEE